MTVDACEPAQSNNGEANSGEANSGEANRWEVLAQLQDLDVRLAQIDHRVAHLAELEVRAAIVAEQASLSAQTEALETRIADLERRQRAHEDEVARIESKRAHNAERLYESNLTSPKEAEALTAEADALARRQIEIEDQILELMEQIEPLVGERSALADQQSAARSRLGDTDAAIAAAQREAADERGEVLAERETLAASADPSLVSLYEQRRAAAEGSPVIGRLIGVTCTACHLELPSVDHEGIVRLGPQEMAECPLCGALLVR